MSKEYRVEDTLVCFLSQIVMKTQRKPESTLTFMELCPKVRYRAGER